MNRASAVSGTIIASALIAFVSEDLTHYLAVVQIHCSSLHNYALVQVCYYYCYTVHCRFKLLATQ